MTADPLLSLVDAVRRRAAARREAMSTDELALRCEPDPKRREQFLLSLRGPELAVISEFKRRSPSAGELAGTRDLPGLAASYAEGGAAALSVLTEEDHFGGALTDLEVARRVGLPLLRKDFLLDEGMVLESHFFGADAILLLAVCLPDRALRRLRRLAAEIGLAVIVEVHNETELRRALAVDPDCIGVNARDLRSLRVDPGTVERLLPLIPTGIVRVAESGMRSAVDLERVRSAGADAALVGEALMRSADPSETLRAWREALSVGEPSR